MSGFPREGPGEGLRRELLRREHADQAARSAGRGSDREQRARLVEIDEDNTAWLKEVVESVGWPGRTMVGEEGAHAAWLIAQHADRQPALQERWLALMEGAVAAGEASAADLAHLTDRVRLARGELQVYGTQTTGADGRWIACRLCDPESVNERRASVGLGSLEAYLEGMLGLYGPPTPAPLLCPNCGAQVEVWLPELGGQSSIQCSSCRSTLTIRTRTRAIP